MFDFDWTLDYKEQTHDLADKCTHHDEYFKIHVTGYTGHDTPCWTQYTGHTGHNTLDTLDTIHYTLDRGGTY